MFQPVNCTVSYNAEGENERRFNLFLKRICNTLIHQDVADELGDLIPNENTAQIALANGKKINTVMSNRE